MTHPIAVICGTALNCYLCESVAGPEKVERAYLRTDLFDKRAELMREWADFLNR
ncbi:MAG: hypothetical protein OXF64_07910 [bacterium]|nr:hypothetical protein [bacterium]MCY4272546.1 hypothetical protein [bacterium]